MVTRRSVVFLGFLALSGCSLEKQTTPALSGPSEMGLSLTVTVTPDSISQDGVSEATVLVVARDHNGQRKSAVQMRVEMRVGGVVNDTFGQIATRSLSTDNAGEARTTYIAPPPPPANSEALQHRITFVVTPIGTNFDNASPRTADLQVVPPGDRMGPNGLPLPKFTFSPSSPRDDEAVFFDASASTDDGTIVSYAWDFGDGSGASGRQTSHAYALAGVYRVVLTVTDDRGKSASTAPVDVTVIANALPVASFVFSPTEPAAGTAVFFNAALSTASRDRTLVDYEWDFGDGTRRTEHTHIAQHSYALPGKYTVVLKVRDSAGLVHSVSKEITIQ